MSKSLSRAARLRDIENILFRTPSGVKVVDLANKTGVNRRTIYRDLELLEEAGVPIWQSKGLYGLIRDQYLATIRLNLHEAIALYISSRLLARHADEHNPNVVSALSKLATAFPEQLMNYINHTTSEIENQPVNNRFVLALNEISLCWAENRKVEIEYYSVSSQMVKRRKIAPYMLEPSSSGGLYIIGQDDLTNSIRTFKIDRVKSAYGTNEYYSVPNDFDPTAYLADAWGIISGNELIQIQLEFSPAVAKYIEERIWHPSQTISLNKDGSLILTLNIDDTREIKNWIRSWGAEVVVIKPEELRSEIEADARKLLEKYHQRSNDK